MKRITHISTAAAFTLIMLGQTAFAQPKDKSIKELNAAVRAAEKRLSKEQSKVTKTEHSRNKILIRMIQSEKGIIELEKQQMDNDSGQVQEIEKRINEIKTRPIPTEKMNRPTGPAVNAQLTVKFPNLGYGL